MNVRLALLVATLAACTLGLTGCNTIYYSTWEKLGWEKRDLLVDQVEDTRNQQEDTKQQFTSALEQFKATFSYDGGELEDAYDKLKKNYDRCASEADDLRGEIKTVKEIAGDLFKEWDGEIAEQTNAEYKKLMTDQRKATEQAYDEMVGKMDAAAGKMDPVLQAFNERVLMLKSSLNAQAIASLQTSSDQLVGDIEALIAEMNASIAEADEFIATMNPG